MPNIPNTVKAQVSIEESIIQQMTVSELLIFKILQNYRKVILIKFLSITFLFFSNPFLKSSGFVGIIFTSIILAYIHFRFGSIVFATFLSLILTLVLFYLGEQVF